MSKRDILKFLVLRSIGNFLLLFAIFGVLATFGPTLYYELLFRIAQARGVTYQVVTPLPDTQASFDDIVVHPTDSQDAPAPGQGFAEVLAGDKTQILLPKDPEFSLVIPKLGASTKIFPNVDPTNESEFLPLLQIGVAHAKGTVFPGLAGNIYLFAHSTDNFWDVGRYNAVFYLIKDLGKGDDVTLFFENRRYNYTVYDSRIVDPSDVSYLTHDQAAGSDQTLILQTCWPPGTTWKRLLVFAKPK